MEPSFIFPELGAVGVYKALKKYEVSASSADILKRGQACFMSLLSMRTVAIAPSARASRSLKAVA